MAHRAYEIAPDLSDDDEDLIATSSNQTLGGNSRDKGKARDTTNAANGATAAASGASQPALSGKIGSAPGSIGERTLRQNVGGLQTETRYTGSDTLDEPVSETIMRDLRAIGTKIVQVLHPSSDNAVLREWDLWGPLIFCLALAVLLSTHAPPEQSLSIFTGVFVIVWLGSAVVTINAKLLGGKVSFFQSLCVLGYCVFPITLAAVVAAFVRMLIIRIPVCALTFAWSVYAAINFLGGTRLEQDRAVLAVFPMFMLYFLLGWMTMLS